MKYLHNDPYSLQYRRNLRRNQTDSESQFWSKVRNKQFHDIKFFRQYSIGPYILDFYAPKERVAVEIDGGQHNEKKGNLNDEKRTGYLIKQNVRVVRFWNNDVLLNIDGVLEELEKFILK
jgi:very-short-patch-repair endonuclease